MLHESSCTGTFGTEQINQIAHEQLFWPGMQRDVKECVESSDLCLKQQKTPQKYRHSVKLESIVTFSGAVCVSFAGCDNENLK